MLSVGQRRRNPIPKQGPPPNPIDEVIHNVENMSNLRNLKTNNSNRERDPINKNTTKGGAGALSQRRAEKLKLGLGLGKDFFVNVGKFLSGKFRFRQANLRQMFDK